MIPTKHLLVSGSTAILAWLLVGTTSQAAFFTYQFSGQVTAVDNPNGFFTEVAEVGAPVSGSFTYTDSANGGPFSINSYFTNHTHQESPTDTMLLLRINDTEAHSSANSLTNMIVGNDNPEDSFPPFFPIGDSFRHSDTLDDTSALFDFSEAEFFQFANAGVFLADSSAAAFDSQALPSGLPLSAFDQRYGVVDINDDNFEITGKLVFQIDSIRAVPEPRSGWLLCVGLAAAVIRTSCRTWRGSRQAAGPQPAEQL